MQGMKHFNIIPKSFVIPEDMKQFLSKSLPSLTSHPFSPL